MLYCYLFSQLSKVNQVQLLMMMLFAASAWTVSARTLTSFSFATCATWPCIKIAMVCRTFLKDSGFVEGRLCTFMLLSSVVFYFAGVCSLQVELSIVCCALIKVEHSSRLTVDTGLMLYALFGFLRCGLLTQFFWSP